MVGVGARSLRSESPSATTQRETCNALYVPPWAACKDPRESIWGIRKLEALFKARKRKSKTQIQESKKRGFKGCGAVVHSCGFVVSFGFSAA